MEIKDYCKNIEVELSQWQEKLDHIVSKRDSMPTGSKEKVYKEVNDLHMPTKEICDQLERLRAQYSISWEPEFNEATPTISGSSKRFNDVSDVRFDYDFGG